MKVSIITACFNSQDTIRTTIESVLHQTYPDIEYLIIDGASADGTVELARSYERAFAEKGYTYRIISEPDGGTYDAMNKGISLATGELIGIINSDDWYEPIAAETAARVYEETGYDMFYADLRLVRLNGKTMVKRSRESRIITTRHWNHPTTFVPRAVYGEMGAYTHGGISADFDLMLRMRGAGRKVEIRNVVLANFRSGGVSSARSLKALWYRFQDRYSCYRDNGYSRLYVIECLAMEVAKFILA